MQRNATFCEDVIDENGLEIGNDGRATHHWTRQGHEGESIIDLTLASRPITQASILGDNHATQSDHKVIEWQVEADRHKEGDNATVIGCNLAAMMDQDVEAVETVWRELAGE